MNAIDYKYIATEIGDMIKYNSSVNVINRAATATFNFPKDSFPNEFITSVRAKEVYDWIMTLARQSLSENDRNILLRKFCERLVPDDQKDIVNSILEKGGIRLINPKQLSFEYRNFHAEIHKHCRQLFFDNNFFHAVFEACKVYNKLVKEKSLEKEDGESLMMRVWDPNGVLKITPCKTETDFNVQNGIKFLSAGLMRAIRNPTSHEPAIDWPIAEEDCLNILSFLSFLFKKLDDAVYFKKGNS